MPLLDDPVPLGDWLAPWKYKLRRMTCAVFTKVPVVMLMITPAMLPAFRIEPKPSPCVPSIVIALVIVTDPKPPGSRTSISPPSAVLEIAPANVLHGAVRLHGFASLPTPETQVRVAWADAELGTASAMSAKAGTIL